MISGSRGRYIDPMVAYDLVEVVGRVPSTWVTVPSLAEFRASFGELWPALGNRLKNVDHLGSSLERKGLVHRQGYRHSLPVLPPEPPLSGLQYC